MLVSNDTITVREWANDSSLTKGSLRNRQRCVRYFEKANRASIAEILADIKSNSVNVYSLCKRFVDSMRENRAPFTVYVYRSMLPGLFQSVLGEENFKRSVFDRLVPCETPYIQKVKKIPTREELVTLLKLAGPVYRAVLGGLACTGMRIGEWLSREMVDLEVRPEGYARVRLQASETKARYKRYAFLTLECVEWVKLQQLSYPSDFVFAGENEGHLREHSAQQQIKILYRQSGLHDAPDKSEIYCAHSLRTFAGDEMRACGLRERNVLAIIGHKNKLAADSSYIDWARIEKEWVESCAEKMCFLDNGAVHKERIDKLEKQNGRLETLLEKLLERLA